MTNQKCFPYSPLFRHLHCCPVFSQCYEHLTSPCWPSTQDVTVTWWANTSTGVVMVRWFTGWPLSCLCWAMASRNLFQASHWLGWRWRRVPRQTAAARLIGSSALDRSSGLGWEGGACSEVGGDVSSCCILWVWRRRSWTRSSNMASCSSWMAWFRWVFLFCRETQQRHRLDWCI